MNRCSFDRAAFFVAGRFVRSRANPHDALMVSYVLLASPWAYLDEGVRRAISTFSRVRDIQGGLNKLKADLANGVWHKRYGNLLQQRNRLWVSDVVFEDELSNPAPHRDGRKASRFVNHLVRRAWARTLYGRAMRVIDDHRLGKN